MSVAAAPSAAAAPAGRRRRTASWALAAQLARREVRRRKGRTALVMALVALPVIAMTIGSVVYRTTRDAHADGFRREHGTADLVEWRQPTGSGVTPAVVDPDSLPEGSRAVEVHQVYGEVVSADGRASAWVEFTDLPLSDPTTTGMVRLVDGRVPQGADEALLSPAVAEDFGVSVGDVLTLRYPPTSYEVVGIGRPARSLDGGLMVVGAFDFAGLDGAYGSTAVRIDLPAGVDAADVVPVADGRIVTVEAPAGWRGNGSRADVVWGWVGGALALTVMGIIIAAAFATSARRQLVTLGQLASNGADRKLLRRTLALQGAWSGLFGTTAGLALGLALVMPQHGLLERIVNHTLPRMRVAPLDLVVIAVTGVIAAAVAAFVPSRSITRVPVLSALSGRRPLGKVPRWLVPIGLVLFGGGLALIALAAAAQTDDGATSDRNLLAAVAVIGGLGVLFGMCSSTPAIVSGLGPLGERLRGTARLSARSLARVRTRTAAIVTAIAAAGALCVGGATAVSTSWGVDESYWSDVPYLTAEMVGIQAYDNGASASASVAGARLVPVLPDVPADALAALQEQLPTAELLPIRAAVDPQPLEASEPWRPTAFVIADDSLVDALGLDEVDRRALAAGAALYGFEQPGAVPGPMVPEPGSRGLVVRSFHAWPRFRAPTDYPLISAERAGQLGFVISSPGALLINDEPLTRPQLDAVAEVRERFAGDWSPFQPLAERPVVMVSISAGDSSSNGVSKTLVDGMIVVAALMFVLAVVAVGLALSAAEARDERDVLLAVGAPPRAMRRVSAQKAVLLAAIGGVLAVPTGFLPVAAVMAQTSDEQLRFPWFVALGCVAVVPLLVGLATFVGSAIAQRVRPIRMSALAAD